MATENLLNSALAELSSKQTNKFIWSSVDTEHCLDPGQEQVEAEQ